MPIYCRSEDSQIVENNAHCSADQRRCQVTIDTLPDDALLYVFYFYVDLAYGVEAWHALVHVCRRWRTLVFASPRRLDLRIVCTDRTPVREKLDVWPRLPIIISGVCEPWSMDNIIAALEHRDRVCQIKLSLLCELEDILKALEEPFPELTDLELQSTETPDPVFPYSGQYLGGTTHLRSLSLFYIPIPGLPNLLSSSTDLVDLRLMEIPISVFVFPDEMVTALSALTRLQVLHLGPEFEEFHDVPDCKNRSLSLPTRTALPSLIELTFEGATDYLDDFMARIDTPILDRLDTHGFFYANRAIVLETPHLLRFISRIPKLKAPDIAYIEFDKSTISITFLSTRTSCGGLKLETSGIELERHFPAFLAQFCRPPFSPLPMLEYLYIDGGIYSRQCRRDYTENTRWLELLQPFTSVKDLYLSEDFAPHIAPALEELGGEMATEVLPTLENVFIEKFHINGPVNEAFENFATMRQLSGLPIVISDWDIMP